MKKTMRVICRATASIMVVLVTTANVNAQNNLSVTGSVVELGTNEPIPFANVALYNADGQTLVAGASCTLAGDFTVNASRKGLYKLTISAIGFESVSKKIDLSSNPRVDLGTTHLTEQAIGLQGVRVFGERVRAKSEASKNSYNISSEMKQASSTGVDILKFVPGVQVDFMHNISLEGNRNVLILVDGIERDASFINQLNAQNIERIEISNIPPARYDGNVSGVINIILAKNKAKGVDGHLFFELPTSKNMVYLFPSYSLNISLGKLRVFTSYNGEVSKLKLYEESQLQVFETLNDNAIEIASNQSVFQNNWSHRFNYGIDYFINSKNQLNVYAYHNRFSQEYNGNVTTIYNGDTSNTWEANKEDEDKNTSNFYSLYYVHSFKDSTKHTISVDLSLQHFEATSITRYTTGIDSPSLDNLTTPQQQNGSIKLDYNLPISKMLSIKLGAKGVARELENGSDFLYKNNQVSGYSEMIYKRQKLDASIGLRYERSEVELANNFSRIAHNFLPTLSVGYKHSKKHNTRLSYRNSMIYPILYQLNPQVNTTNPYTQHSGNALLEPSILHNVVLEHSTRIKKGFVNMRLYYTVNENTIDNLLTIDDEGASHTKPYNLGTLKQLGLKVSGIITAGTFLTISPSISYFNYGTTANSLAQQNSIEDRKGFGLSTSLSSIVSLGKGLSFSGTFQYFTPIANIQSSRFEDAIYFLALDKEFKNGLKIGVVSAIPLAKEFTYFGQKTIHNNYSSHHSGQIEKSLVPFWFRITYRFASGQRKPSINRDIEDLETIPRKGF
jgi:hypothetical protein